MNLLPNTLSCCTHDSLHLLFNRYAVEDTGYTQKPMVWSPGGAQTIGYVYI